MKGRGEGRSKAAGVPPPPRANPVGRGWGGGGSGPAEVAPGCCWPRENRGAEPFQGPDIADRTQPQANRP
jgi:hypothetical protein